MPFEKLQISIREARRLAIQANALHQRNPFKSGKAAVLRAIEHLGYIQLDTISVVNRAHHHVLWSRVPDYKPAHLDQLQSQDRKVIEYWSHAAAYLPMEDFRYTLWRKSFFKNKKDRWPKPDLDLMKKIYRHVQKEGPTMARDFEDKAHKGGGWWEWKPAKWALERLFLEGDLAIVQRKGFQKIYDLPQRVVPDHIDTSFPKASEYADYLITRCLRAFGLATLSEMVYQRSGIRGFVVDRLKEMKEEGKVLEIKVKGINKESYYVFRTTLENQNKRISKSVRILSPFDNFLIQRKRMHTLFNFDYQIECYVPQAKRKYGYFSLPILYGDQFLGRVDVKNERKTQILHVYNLAFEDSIQAAKLPLDKIKKAMQEFAAFNQCDGILLHRSNLQGLTQYFFNKE